MQVTCDDQAQAQKLAETLSRLPHALIAACGIKELGFKDLGVSREYFPNHGLYVDDKLFLNTQNIDDPIVHKDGSGRTLDRFEHTLYHELGHGLDKMRDNESQRDPWLSLSGWSKEPFPGGLKVIISEEGCEDVHGTWFYDSKASFPRFYAKQAPWEDYADCFAFYVGGLKDFLPAAKIKFLDGILSPYYAPTGT